MRRLLRSDIWPTVESWQLKRRRHRNWKGLPKGPEGMEENQVKEFFRARFANSRGPGRQSFDLLGTRSAAGQHSRYLPAAVRGLRSTERVGERGS